MNGDGSLLVVLTAGFAAIVAALIFAVLRFLASPRGPQGRLRDAGAETAFLSSALQEAVGTLKAQEREMRARAHESEALSEHVVESLAAGLLVVDLAGRVETLNPAGHRLLELDAGTEGRDYREALGAHGALRDLVAACLETGTAASSHAVSAQGHSTAVYLVASVSPLVTSGAAKGVVCVLSDLSLIHI